MEAKSKQSTTQKQTTENFIKDIRRKTRKLYSSEQKILIVMEALRGEESVAAISRKHGIAESMFYKWNKEFMEADKKRLASDTAREATSEEVAALRKENQRLKEMVADLMLRYDIVKKKFDHFGVSEKWKKYMRLSKSEKKEIIQVVERSDLDVTKTLQELGIHKDTFYRWYKAYLNKSGTAHPGAKPTRRQWNTIPEVQKSLVVEIALEYLELSPRELAVKLTDEQKIFISESSVYRILKAKGLITSPAHILLSASNEFRDKTAFVHQMWQTDFTYFKILGWGWYYLSTVLDDYSRFIVHWELCRSMKADDVERTIEQAIKKAGLSSKQRPKLLSDNGSCYIASELKGYLQTKQITHIHGRPLHPQTQGKIERYHRSMKNVVKLDHYYYPEELNTALETFVHHYNHERYHESLDNVTPADVYFGRKEQILKQREKIKQQTLLKRRSLYQREKLLNT